MKTVQAASVRRGDILVQHNGHKALVRNVSQFPDGSVRLSHSGGEVRMPAQFRVRVA